MGRDPKICVICDNVYIPTGTYQKYCKDCKSFANKEVDKQYRMKRYYENLEKSRKYAREKARKRRTRIRLEVITALGGKCIECGMTDFRVLQIDHKEDGGRKELEKYHKFSNRIEYHKHVLRKKDTGKYQLLCANCNWIKMYEKKEFAGVITNDGND